MSESTLRYGLNSGGFVRMRLPEIKRMIFDAYFQRTGEAMDESPNSFTGQNVAIFAERAAELWELAEQVYLGAFPATAPGGVPLQQAVSYSGVLQLQPTRSRAVAYFVGDPGTSILAGTAVRGTLIAENENVAPIFRTENQVDISKASVVSAELVFPQTILAGDTYSVSINSQSYSTVAATGQTSGQIAQTIKQLIGSAAVTTDNVINISSSNPFSIDWSSNIKANSITTPGYLIADAAGPVVAVGNTLTQIQTPVTGWKSVYNPFDAVPGKFLEDSEDLRTRYKRGVYRLGAGTLPSIYANLTQDIPGITNAKVFENNTATTDAEGRPPHTVEAVVEGGDTQLIFDRLHQLKPSGITAFGNTSGFVVGDDGYKHPLFISRPEERWVWLRLQLTTTNEEIIPGDLSGRATAAIVAAGNALEFGQDVLLQRVASAAFGATTGLSRVKLTAAISAPFAPVPATTSFKEDDIVIGARQKAKFDVSRVSVI
jgi:hypothetical protein